MHTGQQSISQQSVFKLDLKSNFIDPKRDHSALLQQQNETGTREEEAINDKDTKN